MRNIEEGQSIEVHCAVFVVIHRNHRIKTHVFNEYINICDRSMLAIECSIWKTLLRNTLSV